ncbi:EcsC family protein [Dysosmobacter sp.]
MGILKKSAPWEREYRAMRLQEQKFLKQYAAETSSPLDRKLAELAPKALLEALHTAFAKAFCVVFEKGTGAIAWAGRRERRQTDCRVRQYAADQREDRKSLRAFSRAAEAAGRGNVLLSGAAGAGMGLFGAVLPDVPLFTAMLLKSVYETAESFGFAHDTQAEQRFILCLIQTALSSGEALTERDQTLNRFIETETWQSPPPFDDQLRASARQLSETVLSGKVLQNIPLVGALGGAADGVCVRRVQRYAAIKYRRRFLIRRRLAQI